MELSVENLNKKKEIDVNCRSKFYCKIVILKIILIVDRNITFIATNKTKHCIENNYYYY
jgi:hypothetical protein